MRKVNGSSYDFRVDQFQGTARKERIVPPDDWGGRAAAEWAKQLSIDACLDPAAERFTDVAAVLDRIYRLDDLR